MVSSTPTLGDSTGDLHRSPSPGVPAVPSSTPTGPLDLVDLAAWTPEAPTSPGLPMSLGARGPPTAPGPPGVTSDGPSQHSQMRCSEPPPFGQAADPAPRVPLPWSPAAAVPSSARVCPLDQTTGPGSLAETPCHPSGEGAPLPRLPPLESGEGVLWPPPPPVPGDGTLDSESLLGATTTSHPSGRLARSPDVAVPSAADETLSPSCDISTPSAGPVPSVPHGPTSLTLGLQPSSPPGYGLPGPPLTLDQHSGAATWRPASTSLGTEPQSPATSPLAPVPCCGFPQFPVWLPAPPWEPDPAVVWYCQMAALATALPAWSLGLPLFSVLPPMQKPGEGV